MTINGDMCTIMRHNDFYVVVDCNVRNACGLGSDIGTSVVVFNTNWQDLVFHMDNLMTSLSADKFSIYGINVDIISSDIPSFDLSDAVGEISACTFKDTEKSPPSTSNEKESVPSIRGSFHQADSQFQWGGKQCVAISLAAMAKHSVCSVFSWGKKDLDNIVTDGDSLYSSLHRSGSISDPTKDKLLCIQDLPQQYTFNSNAFKFEYGDFVSGFVDVVDEEFILSGACVTLLDGLQSMFEKYDTCFLTLNGNTCGIIKENGQFAIVDSHARSETGMVDGDGFSVVVYYNTLSCVLRHIENLSASIGGNRKIFELSGICVHQVKSSKATVHESQKRQCVNKKRKLQGSKLSLEENQECVVVKKQKHCFNDSTEVSKSNVDISDNSEVVCIGSGINRMFDFSPLCHEVKQKLSENLNLEWQGENVLLPTETGPMGSPCKTVSIVGDGNCFFRAVAQAVCGTQKAHRAVRLAIVKHMELHRVEYSNLLRCQYTSMEDYLSNSKMKFVGSWATEVEIQSTSNYLGVDIYTYHNERWLKYSCMHKRMCNQGIYLKHCNENHYEVVICVTQPDKQICYKLCQNEKQDDGKICTRQTLKPKKVNIKNEETVQDRL